jgi:hypothetical protein
LDDPAQEDRLDELLALVQKALINLAYYRGFPILSVKMSDKGAYRTESPNEKSLFKYQEVELRQTFKQDGFNGLDAVLEYLEENIDVFPEFRNSANYTIFKSNFINTTTDFDNIYSIGGSRLVFLKIRRFMNIVEDFKILPLIGQAFYTKLKDAIEENNVITEDQRAIDIIKKAVAFLSIDQGLSELGVKLTDNGVVFETREGRFDDLKKDTTVSGDELHTLIKSARVNGDKYLSLLKEFLHANIDDYPLYRDSEQYDDTNTAHIRDNSGKKTFWT